MDQQTLNAVIAVAAVVITLSFIVQAVMFLTINSHIKKLTKVASSLQAKVEPILDQVQSTVSNVKGAVEKISAQAKSAFEDLATESKAVAAAISTSTREITELARTHAEQFSRTLDQSNTVLQHQVTDFDDLLTRTQLRIEDTTVEVQMTLVKPLRELAAILSGLKRTVEVLFARGRKPIDQAYQDEELFI